MKKKYTADFETTTDINDCRVWAWGIFEIGSKDNFIYGNTIEGFIDWCQKADNPVLYFHNLKFDSEFIFQYLLQNNYECIKDKKDKKDHSFTCLISDTGQFYTLEIYFKVKGKNISKVLIYDSMKLLNFSVEEIAKSFHLEVQKQELDYNAHREVGHILTDDEIKYLRCDVEIMAQALNITFKEGLTKMTIGSNALNIYKNFNRNFEKYFPKLDYEIDSDIRKSYKGGFTYLNPKYENKTVEGGNVYDVNSLYPSVMHNEELPIGQPKYFEGKYEYDPLYPLYVQQLACSFKIKEGKIPTIQIKKSLFFLPNQYIESSDDRIETLMLTSVDLEIFFEHYDVENLIFGGGWKFKSMSGLFSEYIDFYTQLKIQSKKEGNRPRYLLSKLMLNSLYGKFGLNPNVQGKYPVLENGEIHYKLYPKEVRDSIYLPVATFITSYARRKTITTSQKIRDYSLKTYGEDYYIYSDTDSIHTRGLPAEELKDIIDIDPFRLGAWDNEASFSKGRYLRQKCYIEDINGKGVVVTVAGLPKKLGNVINFDNFDYNFVTSGKLVPKHVKGGVVLVDTEFTIKRK